MSTRYASVLILGLILATATAAVLTADPGTASGSLTVNGKTVALSHAFATTQKNPFDAAKMDVLLLLTSVEVPPSAMQDDFGRMRLAGAGNFSGVEVEIDPDGEVISGTLYSPEFKKFNGMVSATGMHKFQGTRTASSIDGTLSIPKEDTFAGYTYRYDATFRAPITARAAAAAPKPAAAGAPLPEGGGAPGKAYREYLAALRAGDEARLARTVDAQHAAQMKDPEFKKMLPVIQAMEPKEVKITGGHIDGSRATLETTASDGTSHATGTIEMVQEGGAWKLSKESWESR